MLYNRTDYWYLSQHQNGTENKMKMLRWVCEVIRKNRIKNNYIRVRVYELHELYRQHERKYTKMVGTCYEEILFTAVRVDMKLNINGKGEIRLLEKVYRIQM